jgi:hypothetical protein
MLAGQEAKKLGGRKARKLGGWKARRLAGQKAGKLRGRKIIKSFLPPSFQASWLSGLKPFTLLHSTPS